MMPRSEALELACIEDLPPPQQEEPMPDDVKVCPSCGRKLRSNNTRGKCYLCANGQTEKALATRVDDGDSGVLDRMGFGALAKKAPAGDEAPPATKVKKPRRPKPPREVQIYPVEDLPKWQTAFRSLTAALGLDPDGMLESYCRDWVETTRARALPPPVAPPQLVAGVVEVRPDTGTGG